MEQALREAVAEQARFSLIALHPDVRIAAEAARSAELNAITAQFRARRAAELAEGAARSARNGETGTNAFWSESAGGAYEGGWANGARNGYGLDIWFAPSAAAGDRYAGQYSGGVFSGVCVYAFAQNPNNTANSLRYEGEWANDRKNGVGVHVWRSGNRHAGGYRDDVKSGPGVFRFADGRRYEGDWANDKYNGHGVLWDAQGRVISAGVWTDNRLTTPLAGN